MLGVNEIVALSINFRDILYHSPDKGKDRKNFAKNGMATKLFGYCQIQGNANSQK